jgi:hypothetical protein
MFQVLQSLRVARISRKQSQDIATTWLRNTSSIHSPNSRSRSILADQTYIAGRVNTAFVMST